MRSTTSITRDSRRSPEEACLRRRDRLLGMLMRGLAGIDGETRQEAMLVLGQWVFGSAQLSNGEKSRAFPLTARKLLTTCRQEDGDALSFYYRASMLGRLYRFLTAQRLRGGFTFEAATAHRLFPRYLRSLHPVPPRPLSEPSGIGASRYCWPSMNSRGPSAPSPTASGGALPPCRWRTNSMCRSSRRTFR